MQRINFEDTTVTRQPYVTIDGTDYEVQEGTYSGGTDLDAYTFNTLQDNIETAIADKTNVELIAVTDTAPSTCSTGDKYYNTTDNLIYTATATNTWSIDGEEPVSGIFYIVFSEQSSYSYDGTTLVSVGGGTEDIVISDTEPTEEGVKLWIDTGEIASPVSEITNSYSTSTGIGYSANYINNMKYEKIASTDFLTLSTGFSFGETNVYKYKNHYTGTITVLKNAKFTSNQETIGTINSNLGTIPTNINTFGVTGATVDDRWSIPDNFAYIYIANTNAIYMRGKTTDAYVKFNIDVILN